MYIFKGSFDFVPIFQAASGETGETIASTSSKTLSKSSIIRVLTWLAFL
jgi:hypothetical protein